MRNEQPLTPRSQMILNEMLHYHRERLALWEASRKRGDDDADSEPSLARAIAALATGELRKAAPREHEAFRDPEGNPHRLRVPFSALRDLTAGVAGAGGYLVQTDVPEAVDILRPFSVVARLGVQVRDGLQGSVTVPRVTATSTAHWLPTEGTQVTPSTPTLGQIALTPHQVGVVVNFSRLLALQANAEAFIRRELLRTIGGALDLAVLTGTGASGEPTGLLNTSGIGSVSGTSFSHSGAADMKRLVAEANAPDEQVAFLATPAVRKLLETRERATGSGFIWDGDTLASRPAYVSTSVPSATIICGAWSEIFVAIWGQGFAVEVNPFDSGGFKAGTLQARILLSCDVAVMQPGAFCVASAVT